MEEAQGESRTNKITPKRTKKEEQEDRISSLPNCLLIEIISRLDSTIEAFKTSTLSKRWQHLWTQVPNIIFINDKFSFYSRPAFFLFVEINISQLHKMKLNKFQLNTRYDNRFESHVNKYIRYAVSCNVQDLDLSLECDSEFRYFIDLYGLLFINSHFTRLKLSCCMLNPNRVISWNKLTSLCIANGKLDEDSIQNILFGSPLLETLNLHKCYGFSRIDITSKSVKKLVLSGYKNPEDTSMSIEINAPNILSLTIQKSLVLWRLNLLNVYSLIETTLDYTTDLIFVGSPESAEECMLKGLILSLSHVKKLKLGYICSKVLSRLEAKGFTIPSNVKYRDILTADLVENGDWD